MKISTMLSYSGGFEQAVSEVRRLEREGLDVVWLAEAAIPASFIEETTLVGDEGFVKERLSQLRESGVTSLNVSFAGRNIDEKLDTLARLRGLVDSL